MFDHVVDELGLGFEAPADPIAATWALVHSLAAQIVDGSLDPATGADLIWVEAAACRGQPITHVKRQTIPHPLPSGY